MKKAIVLVLTAFIVVNTWAGNIKVLSGDLSVIKNSTITATVKFDYTDLMLEGKPYMEQLKSRGDDFVRDWPMETLTSETYFIKCWNKDNDEGLQVSASGTNEYLMLFLVKEMHMGSGAASMLVGFGAGGASMSGTMYIIKNGNDIPVLTVEIDNQTGRSGMTELVRRTDLYGELAEDLVKTLKKTKQSKVPASTQSINLPSSLTSITSTEANTQQPVNEEIVVPEKKVDANKIDIPEKQVPIKVSILEDNDIPSTVINAESNLSLKKGFGGSVASLKNEKRMSVFFDFSSALIDNKSEEDFIYHMTNVVREKERDSEFAARWRKEIKKEITTIFISEVNEALADEDCSLRLISKQGSPYTLKVIVNEIDDNGNNSCDYLVVNTKSGEVVAHFVMEADGGRVGKYVGLIKDGITNAGKEFGEEFAEKIDKSK